MHDVKWYAQQSRIHIDTQGFVVYSCFRCKTILQNARRRIYAYHMDYHNRIACWPCRQVCITGKRPRWVHCHNLDRHRRCAHRNLFGTGNRLVSGWSICRLYRCGCWLNYSPSSLQAFLPEKTGVITLAEPGRVVSSQIN